MNPDLNSHVRGKLCPEVAPSPANDLVPRYFETSTMHGQKRPQVTRGFTKKKKKKTLGFTADYRINVPSVQCCVFFMLLFEGITDSPWANSKKTAQSLADLIVIKLTRQTSTIVIQCHLQKHCSSTPMIGSSFLIWATLSLFSHQRLRSPPNGLILSFSLGQKRQSF